jgi:hypothetical protein
MLGGAPDGSPLRFALRAQLRDHPSGVTAIPQNRSVNALPGSRPTFENHTAGELAQGKGVRRHIATIFGTWPDIHFTTRRLYVRDGVVTQEWTATATHRNTMRRGELVAEPTRKSIEWRGVDVIPFENGLVKRKDVYSDSVSILRQVGLLNAR